MELVRHIVDEAQRLVPQRITFHWQHACKARMISCMSYVLLDPLQEQRVRKYFATGSRPLLSGLRHQLAGTRGHEYCHTLL